MTDEVLIEKIGAKLKEARKNKNMSQEEVAKKLLVSRQSISKWENDICLPDLENFHKICELYGIATNDLLVKSDSLATEKEQELIFYDYTSDDNEKTEWMKNVEFLEILDKKMNIIYFLIPFYWFYFLKKGLHKNNISLKVILLIIMNIMISLAILYAIYCAVPKMTYRASSL